MAEIKGADLLAKSLKEQGVDYMFGIVGFPVVPIAAAAQKVGHPFYRHAQRAGGVLCRRRRRLPDRPARPCLVVTGPGVIHALSGLANAQQNCWPMILIGGASETYRNGMGAFQEERQVLAATPFCKCATRRARRPHPVLRRAGGAQVDLRPARRDATSTSPTT